MHYFEFSYYLHGLSIDMCLNLIILLHHPWTNHERPHTTGTKLYVIPLRPATERNIYRLLNWIALPRLRYSSWFPWEAHRVSPSYEFHNPVDPQLSGFEEWRKDVCL